LRRSGIRCSPDGAAARPGTRVCPSTTAPQSGLAASLSWRAHPPPPAPHPAVAPVHGVVNRLRLLDAQLSGHAPRPARSSRYGQSNIAFSLSAPPFLTTACRFTGPPAPCYCATRLRARGPDNRQTGGPPNTLTCLACHLRGLRKEGCAAAL